MLQLCNDKRGNLHVIADMCIDTGKLTTVQIDGL